MNVQDKVRDSIKNNFVYGIVFVVTLVYIARGLFEIDPSGKTVWEVLGDGCITFIFGFSICKLLSIQGLMTGKRQNDYLSTQKLLSDTIVKVTPFWFYLGKWCDKRNVEALKKARTSILYDGGMRYEDFYDDEGRVKPFTDEKPKTRIEEKHYKTRLKAYNAALRFKVTKISMGDLTSRSQRELDINYLGEDEQTHIKKGDASGITSRVLTAIIFGCFIPMLLEFTWAALLWTMLQAAFFLISGSVNFLTNYFFVITDLRYRTIRKIDILDEFYSEMKLKEETTVSNKNSEVIK